MKKKLLIGAGVVMLLAIVALSGCVAGGTEGPQGVPSNMQFSLNNQQEGIWVNGEGKVMAVPDVANLRIGIESQAATVSEAQGNATKAMNDVMAVLTKNGVDKKDIQTQSFNIQRVTRWDNDKQQEILIGYRVTNSVNAKIRKLDTAGTIIDAAAEAGGDFTRIEGISFDVDNPETYQNQAREKALANAKAKAEQMAKGTGVTLGKATFVTESVYIPGPIFRDLAMKAEASGAPAAAPTPISAGELEIRVNVQVVYSIL